MKRAAYRRTLIGNCAVFYRPASIPARALRLMKGGTLFARRELAELRRAFSWRQWFAFAICALAFSYCLWLAFCAIASQHPDNF